MRKLIGLIMFAAILGSGAVAAEGNTFEAANEYIRKIDLETRMAKYSPGDMDSFKASSGEAFKKAVAEAGDNAALIAAWKAVRGAEIAFLDHASNATRAELDKALGAVKVEMELAE